MRRSSDSLLELCIQKTIVILVLIAIPLVTYIVFHFEELTAAKREGDDEIKFWKAHSYPQAMGNILQNSCKWPIVEMYHKEIKDKQQSKPIICEHLWDIVASLDDEGFLTVTSVDDNNTDETRCYYQELMKDRTLGEEVEIEFEKRALIRVDKISIICDRNGTQVYQNTFINWKKILPYKIPEDYYDEDLNAEKTSLSVLMLPFSSFTSFPQQMPLTWQFLENNNFASMKMYNKIVSGVAENANLVFSGKDSSMNLQDLARKKGCISYVNDDSMETSIFEGSPNYEFSNYYAHKDMNSSKSCYTDGQSKTSAFLDNWLSTTSTPITSCTTSFNYLSAFAGFNQREVAHFDKELSKALERLRGDPSFESTTLVIMGADASDIMKRSLFYDVVKYRNPFFSIRIPELIRSRNALSVLNLEENANRLVTNLDLHVTLRDIINGTVRIGSIDEEFDAISYDGASLLRHSIPTNRTCEDANIPGIHCLCMEEKIERSNSLGNETLEYSEIFKLVEDGLASYGCIEASSPELEIFGLTARAYGINDMISNKVNLSSELQLANSEEYEFIEIGYQTRTYYIPDINRKLKFNGVARVRRRIANNELELVDPIMIRKKPVFCKAQKAEDFCELCIPGSMLL